MLWSRRATDQPREVLPNSVGRSIDAPNLIKYWFYPLIDRAGLPKMRFHDLRHTAATLPLSRGINPKVVSAMLGHSRVSVTLGIYSHMVPHMQDRVASAMDATLGQSRYRSSTKSRV